MLQLHPLYSFFYFVLSFHVDEIFTYSIKFILDIVCRKLYLIQTINIEFG